MSPTKDRLHELRRIQNGGNMSTTESAEDKTEKMNKTFEKTKSVRESIQVIKSNTARANEILKNSVFKISKDLQDELDSLFRTTTTTSYKINNNLKELHSELNKIKNKTSAEFRINQVQYTTLKEEFQEALKESSTSLEFHKTTRRDILKKSLKTAHGDVNDEELEALLEENKLDVFTDNHLVTAEEARQQLADIEERHKELLKIERHLNEVLDLFIKIATLVEEQQESVNRVEYYAETATDFIEHGTKDIEKTVESRRKYKRRKTYCILISIIVVLSIVLIIILV